MDYGQHTGLINIKRPNHRDMHSTSSSHNFSILRGNSLNHHKHSFVMSPPSKLH